MRQSEMPHLPLALAEGSETGAALDAEVVAEFRDGAEVVPGLCLVGGIAQQVGGVEHRDRRDRRDAVLRVGEFAAAQWALPSSASLLGQSFRQQTLPFELAASGAITAVSASNAVQLTIGAW